MASDRHPPLLAVRSAVFEEVGNGVGPLPTRAKTFDLNCPK